MSSDHLVSPDDFARRFALRAPQLMWLLGAGASASAGVPTADDMVWEFKQQLYVSQRRVSLESVADLSNASVREQLQGHIDAAGHYPPAGALEEYAALFEAAFPAESDRRLFLQAKVAGAKPSYGHIALATLMRAKLAPLIWTTNVDALVADACARVYEATGPLTTATLDAPELAEACAREGRWPLEVKLHGDFRSRRLKNTSDELRTQDARLRRVLIDLSQRFGLVVVGYSGRDSSVMDTLEEAIASTGRFPAGFYWLHKGDGAPHSRITHLLEKAASNGIDAGLVTIESFDEALTDLLRLVGPVDRKALDAFAVQRRRWTGAPTPGGRKGWPVVRLNAFHIAEAPTVCRRVVCGIGGSAEARDAVRTVGADKVIVARTRAGVLAFGRDTDVRRAFEPYTVTAFDLLTIETRRLRYESGERGLLRSALTMALARHVGLDITYRRTANLLAPKEPTNAVWQPLLALTGAISGSVTGHPGLTWREGVAVRLDWVDDRLCALLEPRIVFDGLNDGNEVGRGEFARQRSVKRYNRDLSALLDFWADVLSQKGAVLQALGIGDGIDAAFRLSPTSCYSHRASA